MKRAGAQGSASDTAIVMQPTSATSDPASCMRRSLSEECRSHNGGLSQSKVRRLCCKDRLKAERAPTIFSETFDVVEADHGKLKQLIKPVRGFKTLKTAYATIKDFEVMRALRKGQAAIFNLTGDIRGEARIVERSFGIGPRALTEVVAMIAQNLDAKPA